ncbi:hypothetical protein [Candidatus Protochlamydia sp. R18]|uniref:hypothetical protein n=1 Tax=Candidatus Protochlamydia sp. R18 TaxID=1353977 RepID=UPI0005AB5785|nr:hypothetical protein [Candidatus Protochlamydia sp. R18]
MIELNFTTAFMLYLGVTISALLGTWVYSHYRTRKQTIFSTEQSLFVCEYCHFAYLEENIKELNRCPQCNLFNKQNYYKHLNR